MKLRLGCAFFTLLLILGIYIDARGQAESGTIAGVVKDKTGAVVPAASVTAMSVSKGTQSTVQTDSVGGYTISGLLPGPYQVTVSKAGFADYKINTTVTVGSSVTADAVLDVASATNVVEVVGTGPGLEINTQTQEISQVITPLQIQQLPSLTRNPYDFVELAGNISGGDRSMSTSNPQLDTGGGQNTVGYRGAGYSINGQRPTGTEVLLDGIENLNVFDQTVGILIPQDAVQEYRVVTNNFDTQFGRASGGVVDVITKSGSDAFHGDLWEYNRLSAYTANTFDNNAAGVPKGRYTRNQFGYDVGGAIKKDKLFFYQSTEFLRVRSTANLLAYVPDPNFLATYTPPNVQAFFQTYGNQQFNFLKELTKADLPFNAGGAFDSTVPANVPVLGLVNYQAPQDAGGDLPQNTYDMVARLDYNWTDTTRLYFRYARESLSTQSGASFASPYPQYNVGENIYNNNFLLSLNHTFSANVVSTTKASFYRDDVANTFNTALQQTPTLFLYNIQAGAVTIAGQPLQFPGFYDFNTATGGLPFGGPQNTIQLNEDVGWTKGKHTIKIGGEYNYIQLNRGYGAYEQANDSFGKGNIGNGLDNFVTGTLFSFQKAINPNGAFPCAEGAYTAGGKGGNPILTPSCTLTYPLSDPQFARSDRYQDWALYAADSFRVTPRLTLNYGARYEHYGVQHNVNPNLDSNFYYGPGATFFEQVQNGSIQLAPKSPVGGLWRPSWGTIGPRVGFAYDIRGNGKMALRGGYGISYERNFGNVTFNVIQNPPNNATVVANNVPLTVSNLGPFAGSTCPPAPLGCALPPVSPRDVDQNIKVAQTQFWGLTLERQLGSKGVFALEYNGAHAIHLYDIKNINEIGGGQAYLGEPLVTSDPNNPACTAAAPCLTRPNQSFTSINNRGNDGFSHYNALNVRFQSEQFRNTGLAVVANYTYAHSMDNLSTTFSESNSAFNLGYLDPRNPALDFGNSDFDIRHRVALSMNWTEPYFKSSRRALSQVAGGWSISPIFTARTGIPFSVYDSTNALQAIPRYVPSTAIASYKIGGGIDSGSPNLFNLLSLPAANSFGNPAFDGISDFGPYPSNMTARNAFRGPGAWSFDVSVAKEFPITERVRLQFRAEGYDIFNHANMYIVAAGADAFNFTDASGAPGPITIQGKKGGLGAGNAEGAEHDERRFGQFALRLAF